jgi:thiosulfate/3-mercaptopyruvate sulfurtransferase
MMENRLSGIWVLGCLVLTLMVLGCGGSSDPRPAKRASWIVDGAWLEARLDDPQVRILDARFLSEEFQAAHIPGAQRLEPYQIASTIEGVPAQVTPPALAASLLEGLGIQATDTIVVYGLAPEYDPARVVWALRYYGYADVRYLDGGWGTWQENLRPSASGPAEAVSAGTIPESTDATLRVTGDWILNQLGPAPYLESQIQIIDARSPAEYLAGRIPTAIDRRWTINLRDGLILPESELEELYVDLDKQKTTVVYCLAGWRASVSWIVLESLGFQDVRVYDGSWLQWGPPSQFPIETAD